MGAGRVEWGKNGVEWDLSQDVLLVPPVLSEQQHGSCCDREQINNSPAWIA